MAIMMTAGYKLITTVQAPPLFTMFWGEKKSFQVEVNISPCMQLCQETPGLSKQHWATKFSKQLQKPEVEE